MIPEAQKGSRFEPLSALWQVLAAPQMLMILLGLIALALVLGSVIPQIPPEAMSNPQAWLAMQADPFGQSTGFFGALRLYDLYHTLWFRLLLVLTGLVLFVRTLESAELAWRAGRRDLWTAKALAFWGQDPPQIPLVLSLSPQETRAQTSSVLGRHGYWLANAAGWPEPGLVAGRRSMVLWARPLGHGALLLALLGLAIAGTWGWQSEGWQAIPGESRAVGFGTPYAVRLEAFDMHLDDNQRLKAIDSRVTWLEGDREVGQDLVGVGQPATRRGITLRQIGYVPIARMRAWDADGQPLTLDTGVDVLSVTGEAEIRFPSPESQPLVFLLDRDLILALAFEPMCDTGRPALRVDRVQSDGAARQTLGILYESGTVPVDDLRLDMDLTFVPILRVDQRPAMGLVVAGLMLLILALLARWLVPPRLVWIAVEPEGENHSHVQVVGLPGAGTDRWLAQLATRLGAEVSGDA